MNISVINHTNGKVKDAALQEAIRAINRQIDEDFYPHWGMRARLRLEGRSAKDPDFAKPADMRGDAIIYVWDKVDVANAVGYHEQNNDGVPYGFVFTQIAELLQEPWSVTLSHEALEMIADPETNLLVMGPHPSDPERDVFHWFEMCDAVQSEHYAIDGIEVSNFVLPLYFTGTRDTDEVGARNDFLGTLDKKKRTLTSFGINRGGYIGFYDPAVNKHMTFAQKGDAKSKKRMTIKGKAKQTRRGLRYRSFGERKATRRMGAGRAGSTASVAAVAFAEPPESTPRQQYVEIGEVSGTSGTSAISRGPATGRAPRRRPSTD